MQSASTTGWTHPSIPLVMYKNEHPDEEVDQEKFRYPGPNPFTKEQAVLMMADSVEAVSYTHLDVYKRQSRTRTARAKDSARDTSGWLSA